MATSFIQKLKLGFRGWNRRRAEAAARRQADFVSRETSWGRAPQPTAPPLAPAAGSRSRIDLEGLQVAFLDNSGRILHYLDRETGEVIEFPPEDAGKNQMIRAAPDRYRRIPQRSPESEAEDRRAFIASVEAAGVRRALEVALSSSDPAAEFRQALAYNRTVERAWYNFKNERAAGAIERWLGSEPSA